jgi:hypothetical protein
MEATPRALLVPIRLAGAVRFGQDQMAHGGGVRHSG